MRYYIIVTLILANLAPIKAQISIQSPLDQAVYQRKLDGTANLDVFGSYNYPIVTSIQARLTDTSGVPLPGFDWKIIEVNPSKGVFQGQILNAPAGWHKLEVRAVKSGLVLGTSIVNRVGIGDVYMVAGQSNAHGWHDWTDPYYDGVGKGSQDPRVVTHDLGMYCRDTPIPFPSFTQIHDQTKVGMAGRAAWYWGKLGELLVDELQVPVAFFNSAASGSSSKNWAESSQGLPTINPFTGVGFCGYLEENGDLPYDTVGMPYSNFKRGLNLYNSLFGVKSVLWHQGESDSKFGATTTEYINNVSSVINKSRTDFSPGLPWMISRASYIDGTSFPAIIDAQNALQSPPNQIFGGPWTDWINNVDYPDSRDWINLHFSKDIGFPFVTDQWIGFMLYTGFMDDAVPITHNTPPVINTSINNTGQVVMSVPSGYSTYQWIRTDLTGHSGNGNASEGSSNTLTKTTGTYRCWVGTSNGNLQISAPVDVTNVLSLTQNGTACTADVFISDLQYQSATNGLGPVEINKTNGLGSDGDGVNITLNSQPYAKGLGVYGNSEVSFRLPENAYYRLQAKIGMADDVSSSCTAGGVIYKVIGDGVTLFTSGTIKKSSGIQDINVNISGKKSVTLKTEEVTASGCNRVVWADAKLKCMLGDTIPPTQPTALSLTDTLTRCLTYQWAASTDNIAVTGYEIYKNGVLQTTLPPSTLTYRVSGLSENETVNFGVLAKDAVGNTSPLATLTFTTPTLNVQYMGPAAFCVSRTYLPSVIIPKGGVFSLVSGTSATVNSSTGAFYTDRAALDYTVQYTIGQSVPACTDSRNVPLGTIPPPAAPVISTSNTIANTGTSITFTSSTCESGSNLSWSFTTAGTSPQTLTPLNTQTYFAECRKSYCYAKSNEITVKIIPDCYTNLSLANPTDNLVQNTSAVKFNASQGINANNIISPTNKVEYNSAKSVTLTPGFSIQPGVTFTAQIKNCP